MRCGPEQDPKRLGQIFATFLPSDPSCGRSRYLLSLLIIIKHSFQRIARASLGRRQWPIDMLLHVLFEQVRFPRPLIGRSPVIPQRLPRCKHGAGGTGDQSRIMQGRPPAKNIEIVEKKKYRDREFKSLSTIQSRIRAATNQSRMSASTPTKEKKKQRDRDKQTESVCVCERDIKWLSMQTNI